SCHLGLACGSRVSLNFRQAKMARYRGDLMRGAPGLGESPAGCLSEAMRAAPSRQLSLVAPFPEKVAEAGGRGWLPLCGPQEGEIIAGCRVENLRKRRVDRDFEGPPRFPLPHDQRAFLYMLAPHDHDIRAALRRVEQ